MGTVICPFATREFELIKENHSTLASTGCTRDFCQSGRIIHTDEPRVGENRPISSIEQDAEGFLRELLRDGFFASEQAFEDRLKHVLYEIRSGAVEGIIRESKEMGLTGGNWTQTPAEIEFGIRRAWRNARKCIMRSHCEDLKLCDLRNVTSSTKMAVELMKALSKAYNDGNILPTVFVFPPRTPNNRGPMVWNDQLLTFAAYELEGGEILGDPKNLQFTKDIIELGWVPPKNKTRFDLLPVVVMAEGDLPVIVELPAHLRKLIEIRHPEYPGLGELGLKWAAFPALSRLGFDIGGVQYTATPFIGWFMEAEIGTRNLADTFRYNVLPDVVKALHLADDALKEVDSFDDLPEYEKLALLSRAQTELNYAVQHSFIREKITMSDSLTASIKFSRYDDEFQKKHGFRLPSDPFWVAPPQGSIIPLWHRGAAPNYQPKPMICRHVQEPAKAWRREKASWPVGSTAAKILVDGATGYSMGSNEIEPSVTPDVFVASISKNDETLTEPPPTPEVPPPAILNETETIAQEPSATDDLTIADLTLSRTKPTPPIRAYPIVKKSTSQNSPAAIRDMFFARSGQGSPSALSPVLTPRKLEPMKDSKPGTTPSTRGPVPSTPSFSLGMEEISTPNRLASPRKSDEVNGRNNSITAETRIKSPTTYALPSWTPQVHSTEPSPPLNGSVKSPTTNSSANADAPFVSTYTLPSWTPQVNSKGLANGSVESPTMNSSENADAPFVSTYTLPSWTPQVNSAGRANGSVKSSTTNSSANSDTPFVSTYTLPSWTPQVNSTGLANGSVKSSTPNSSANADAPFVSTYTLPSWTPQVNSTGLANGSVKSPTTNSSANADAPFVSTYTLPPWTPQVNSKGLANSSVKSSATNSSANADAPFVSTYTLPSWTPQVNSTGLANGSVKSSTTNSSANADAPFVSTYTLPSWTPQVNSTGPSAPLNGSVRSPTTSNSSTNADASFVSTYTLPSWTPQVNSTGPSLPLNSSVKSPTTPNSSANADAPFVSTYTLPSWTPQANSTEKASPPLNGSVKSSTTPVKANTPFVSTYTLPSWAPRVEPTAKPSPRSVNSVTASPGLQVKSPVTPSVNGVNGVIPQKPGTQSLPAVVSAVRSPVTSQAMTSNNLKSSIPVPPSYSTSSNGRAGLTARSAETQKPLMQAVPTPKITPKVEPPKKADTPKPVEPPKKVETPKRVEPPKKIETPKYVDPPKKAVPVTQQAPKEAPVESKSGGKGTPASVAIYYCSAGTIAEKLATKLRDKTKALAKTSPHISLDADVHPLDDLEASEMTADKVFLLVISTTGTGEIPANGTDFADMCDEIIESGHFEGSKGFKYAIFGNGDTRYTTTFNFAATKINDYMKKVGGVSLIGSFYEADTAVQSPPWSALNKYWAQVQEKIS